MRHGLRHTRYWACKRQFQRLWLGAAVDLKRLFKLAAQRKVDLGAVLSQLNAPKAASRRSRHGAGKLMADVDGKTARHAPPPRPIAPRPPADHDFCQPGGAAKSAQSATQLPSTTANRGGRLVFKVRMLPRRGFFGLS